MIRLLRDFPGIVLLRGGTDLMKEKDLQWSQSEPEALSHGEGGEVPESSSGSKRDNLRQKLIAPGNKGESAGVHCISTRKSRADVSNLLYRDGGRRAR